MRSINAEGGTSSSRNSESPHCGFATADAAAYQGGMLRRLLLPFLTASLTAWQGAALLHAQDEQKGVISLPAALPSPSDSPAPKPSGQAPAENRYDVLSKTITPMAGVLLGGDKVTNRALSLKATVGEVGGRLPKIMQGATFRAQIEYPGKIRLEAPIMGETVTVCRNGNQVWAIPGSKIAHLLNQFRQKPRPHPKGNQPLELPFTSQQAILLPALFQLEKGLEVAEIDGVPCRVISGGLIPEVGKAAGADDFSSKLWISPEYTPKRIDIHRNDFAMSFLVADFSYTPTLPPSTWQPPADAKDVFRCDESRLEELLYVVMNSLQMSEQDKPWLNEHGPAKVGESLGQ